MTRLITTIAILFLSGCAWLLPPPPALAPKALTEVERAALVDDLVDALRGPFPPAKTQLVLTPGEDQPDGLIRALAQGLRDTGYALAHTDAGEGVALSVQWHDPADGQLFVRLGAGPVWRWTRLYARQGSGLAALSGPTVRLE